MPLLDHFRPPLSEERHWESFHSGWANEIMALLNEGGLPPGYLAETQIHFGGRVEIDVAALRGGSTAPSSASNGGVAVETVAGTEVMIMPAIFPDEVEVLVFERTGGPTLVGAIELVSPRNKDRPDSRRAFAAKCATYLQSGVGLLVVDIVTARQANLHDELIRLLEQEETYRFPAAALVYAVAYRPLRTRAVDQIEIRSAALTIGQPLPSMPLALREGPSISIDLESSYTTTRRRSQL